MKLLVIVLLASCAATPKPCPTPAPSAHSCTAETMPPLVKTWLATLPLPAPNDDVIGLLVTWAASSCSAQNAATP